mgnify:CR=1 FL=1
MKTHSALDHDGLDGILPIVKTTSSSASKFLIWIVLFVILIVAVLTAFWIKQKKPVADDQLITKTELAGLNTQKNSTDIKPEAETSIEAAYPSIQEIKEIKEASLDTDIARPIELTPPVAVIADIAKINDIANTSMPVVEKEATVFPDKQADLDAKKVKINFSNRVTTNITETFLFKHATSSMDLISADDTQRLIEYVKRCDSSVMIVGHTCNLGVSEYNQYLGLVRAKAMQQFLIKQNINPDILKVSSDGMNKPIADNSSISGRRKNRRVELLCIKDS